MIVSRKILGWSKKPTRMVVIKTWPYSVIQRREKEKDQVRVKERVRSKPHNLGRRTFICHNFRHYASQCSKKKKGKGKK
jgi:hypothetical protein